MKRMTTRTAAAGALLAGLVAGYAAAGPEWQINDASSMKLSFLGQVHASYTDASAPDANRGDAYLRRARIILDGQITDGVRFFVETDNDNAGRNGMPAASTDIQDAFVDVRIAGLDHWVKAGLILLPFSFENRASAASLLGNDYNSEAIKLVNTFVWRDMGAELHGNFGARLAYAVGLFDGYDGFAAPALEKNADAPPRLTGHVAVNLLGDVETGWFYTQNRLHKTPYLSVGAGLDAQDDATRAVSTNAAAVAEEEDARAVVVDVQSGFNLGDRLALTVNAAVYEWDSALFRGNTGFVESGLTLDRTMLTLKYSQTRPSAPGAGFGEDYTAGLHYFLKGHGARAGLEYRWGTSPDQALLGVQFLL
ncbi:MAG: hypothetical protein FJ225_12085 [Lentisphaerae bacterium]|nr:hypothetical protein [Lentisphaerota bacterium]